MKATENLDLPLLQDYLDNLGLPIMQQMLDLYIQQSEMYVTNIVRSLSDGSQESWQEMCHKMKGAAGSVGLPKVRAKLATMEKSQEMMPLKQVHFRELSELNEEGIAALKVWLE